MLGRVGVDRERGVNIQIEPRRGKIPAREKLVRVQGGSGACN